MKTQRRMIVMFVLCVVLAAGLNVYNLTRSSGEVTLTLATGSSGGTYHAMGRGIKAAIERHSPSTKISLAETGGSRENAQRVAAGKADLAFVQGSAQPDPHIKSIANLYAEVLQIVVRTDSGIASLQGLKGKAVGLGAEGGGTHRLAELVLNHYGLAPTAYAAKYMGFADAVKALRAGELDGAFFVAGLPTEALGSPGVDGTLRFLPVDHGAALAVCYPFLRTCTIPQGLYSCSPPSPRQDVPSVAVSAVLVAGDHLDTDLVHEVTAALFMETSRIVGEGHIRGADIDEQFAQQRPVFPLHEGAQDYYHRKEPPISADLSEFLGMLFSLLIPAAGMAWAAVVWLARRKKDRIDEYYRLLHGCFQRAHAARAEQDVAAIERELIALKDNAFRDVINEKLLANDAFLVFQREFAFCFDYLLARREAVQKHPLTPTDPS